MKPFRMHTELNLMFFFHSTTLFLYCLPSLELCFYEQVRQVSNSFVSTMCLGFICRYCQPWVFDNSLQPITCHNTHPILLLGSNWCLDTLFQTTSCLLLVCRLVHFFPTCIGFLPNISTQV